jgi:RNA polymerase sigma-70 factor, ECF subfamily
LRSIEEFGASREGIGMLATRSVAGVSAEFPAREQTDLGAIFDREAPDLLRMVERMIGPGPQVEDVVQETFLIAHEKRSALTSVSPRPWLFRTALNVMRHHRRSLARRSRLAAALDVEPASPSPLPDDAIERKERSLSVHRCVQRLPHKLREVFVLFELEAMSGREIASLLRIREATVHSRLHQARRRFKEAWMRFERREEPR